MTVVAVVSYSITLSVVFISVHTGVAPPNVAFLIKATAPVLDALFASYAAETFNTLTSIKLVLLA